MRDDDSIGGRVAVARRLRGLTQRELADRAHISHSLLTKVEAGHAPATPAFIAAVARALRVDSTQLTGQPYRGETPREDRVHATIPDLRRELVAYSLPPVDDVRPRETADLRAAVAEVSRLRHGVQMIQLGEALPGLLGELRAAAHTRTGTEREQVFGLLAETYDAARQLTYKLGYIDLAALIADRYEWSAGQSGDPLAVCVGDTMRAAELIGAGEWNAAQRVMTASRDGLEPELGKAGKPTWSVWGYLHLEAGLATARAGDADTTSSHLAEARKAADRIGTDRDDYRLWFGPTNVGIWSVALAVELGDGGAAIERARGVRLFARTPKERAGHHYIDLARGYLWHGDRESALSCLLTARKIAPQQTRCHPMVRETVHSIARAERRSTETLRGLAAWLGLIE
jgi:transcriptional regulator with XRE-family HTH domain